MSIQEIVTTFPSWSGYGQVTSVTTFSSPPNTHHAVPFQSLIFDDLRIVFLRDIFLHGNFIAIGIVSASVSF